MATSDSLIPAARIERTILSIRGHNVMLDSDLAEMYGVPTKVLNQAVRRNLTRFPDDFMIQLTVAEAQSLRSQSVTLKIGRGQHRKYLPSLALRVSITSNCGQSKLLWPFRPWKVQIDEAMVLVVWKARSHFYPTPLPPLPKGGRICALRAWRAEYFESY